MNSDTRTTLEFALRIALDHLSSLDERPVNATASIDELRRRLHKPLQDRGLAAEEVLQQPVADVAGGLNASSGGRFYAWVTGGAVPAALVLERC